MNIEALIGEFRKVKAALVAVADKLPWTAEEEKNGFLSTLENIGTDALTTAATDTVAAVAPVAKETVAAVAPVVDPALAGFTDALAGFTDAQLEAAIAARQAAGQ